MRSVRYEELLPHEICAARAAFPVAYLPLGTLEWHGHHNAVGLDGLKAHTLCCRFATAIGGLVMPPVWWGDHRADLLEVVFTPQRFSQLTRDHRVEVAAAYGLTHDQFVTAAERSTRAGGWDLFIAVVQRALQEIESFGFEQIVCITGHYPEHGPTKRARDAYLADGGAAVVHVHYGYDLIADEGYRGDHAAKWETSLLMALRPECVDASRIERGADEPLGVLGAHPREASREYGEAAIERMTVRLRSVLGVTEATVA